MFARSSTSRAAASMCCGRCRKGEHRDIVGTAPPPPVRESRRQVGDAQPQPVAEFLLQVRRRPFDQPWTVPATDGQRITLRQVRLDCVVADLAQVKPLQQVGGGRVRAEGGLSVGKGHQRKRSRSDRLAQFFYSEQPGRYRADQ